MERVDGKRKEMWESKGGRKGDWDLGDGILHLSGLGEERMMPS